MVSCSGFGLPLPAQLLRLFVTIKTQAPETLKAISRVVTAHCAMPMSTISRSGSASSGRFLAAAGAKGLAKCKRARKVQLLSTRRAVDLY